MGGTSRWERLVLLPTPGPARPGGPAVRPKRGPPARPEVAGGPSARSEMMDVMNRFIKQINDDRDLGHGVRGLADMPELACDVTPTTVVLGALASRDWRPMHHDKDFAQRRNGVRDIFMNTPNQASWFERYLSDWTGPYGRLGRVHFRMRDSIFPGDRMVFRGTVENVETDAMGCGWAEVSVRLSVGDHLCTECRARIAVPVAEGDNPWKRKAGQWQPEG